MNTLSSALPTQHHYEMFSSLWSSFPAGVLGGRVDRVKDSSTHIPQNNPSLPGSPLNNQMHNKVGFSLEEFLFGWLGAEKPALLHPPALPLGWGWGWESFSTFFPNWKCHPLIHLHIQTSCGWGCGGAGGSLLAFVKTPQSLSWIPT